MNQSNDISSELAEQVREAAQSATPLAIHAGGTKAHLGREIEADALDVSAHQGVINYAPTELVITARSGTPLKVIEQILTLDNQQLPFEPPAFGEHATLGGTIACNLSGPSRPYSGAARDFMLGCRLINGRGELLRFGGEVMKNVAGYDVSRLMAGAYGTLGILTELSLKVLPRAEHEVTLLQEAISEEQAQQLLQQLSQAPLPLSASCLHEGRLWLRLSGTPRAVEAAAQRIGGEPLGAEQASSFWHSIKEHQHPFFDDSRPLWRLALPNDTLPLPIEGDWLQEWGGAQRWLLSTAPAGQIRLDAQLAGGHATLWRGGDRQGDIFQPLSTGLLHYHQRLKAAFDPQGVLNRGRLYPQL